MQPPERALNGDGDLSPSAEPPRQPRPWVLVIWPAFLMACILEALVFAVVDPSEVHWPGHSLQPTRQGIYTVAFFCFWLIAMAGNSLVLWLTQPLNDRPGNQPAQVKDRPAD